MIRNSITIRSVNIRSLHTTRPAQSFLGDWFNRKKTPEQSTPAKVKRDIVKEQDDFEVDPNAKVVILNKKNSPKYEQFKVETHMPDFHIKQWKQKIVSPKQIEETYTSEDLLSIINQVYGKVNQGTGETLNMETLKDHRLDDLNYRFTFAKELQKTLGFDISDYILTKSHDLEMLFNEVEAIINSRYKNERNPNDIALRPEDFSAPNIYVNEELSEFEQNRKLKQLVEKARQSL